MVEKVKMRLLGVMTSEQRLTVRTKLTKLSILGAILGPRTVTVSVSLGCSLLKELSRGFFLFEDFFCTLPNNVDETCFLCSCKWALFSCDTWCLVPASASGAPSHLGHTWRVGVSGLLKDAEYLVRRRARLGVLCFLRLFILVRFWGRPGDAGGFCPWYGLWEVAGSFGKKNKSRMSYHQEQFPDDTSFLILRGIIGKRVFSF